MATEKTAGNGATEKGLYTKGVFELTASSAIPAGSLVTLSGANQIIAIIDTDALISGAVVGKAWEDIASAGEVHVGEVI